MEDVAGNLDLPFPILYNCLTQVVPDNTDVQVDSISKNQPCSKCGKSFEDLILLARHFNKDHERIDDRFRCPICPKTNSVLPTMIRHVKSDHLGRTSDKHL